MYVLTKTFESVIFDTIIFVILLSGFPRVYSGRQLSLTRYQSDCRSVFMCVMLWIVSIFCFADKDFYEYYIVFSKYLMTGVQIHMEPVYFLLADIIPDYFIWRTVIWGTAAILMTATIKRLKLNVLTTWVFIGLFYAIHFFKLRNALGFSIAFYGLSFITYPINYRRFSKLFGIIIIGLSYFFHSSMIITIAFIAVSFVQLNKTMVIGSFIAWPFLLSAVTILLNYAAIGELGSLSNDSGFNNKAVIYSSGSNKVSTIYGIMRNILDYSAIYLPLLYFVIKVYIKNVQISKPVKIFLNYWYISFYAASLFILQNASSWIFIRIYTMGLFPMCVVLGYYFAEQKRTTMMRFMLLLALTSCLFGLFYGIYKY